MARQDVLTMRPKEFSRLHVIRKVLAGEVTQVEASEVMCLSERQVRRLVRRVEREGDRGVIHHSRGRGSNRAYPEKVRRKVIELYEKKYGDFGPTFFTEKLVEVEGIVVGRQTVRNWLTQAGAWVGVRKSRRHRQWRQRKSYFGEMVQMDGSAHDWLEGRGRELVLMAYIDDATNRVTARFYDYEGTLPAMDSFRRYVRRHGLPASIYLDKHTTYKSNGKPTLEDHLAGRKPESQFERAMRELGVQLIHAHSPQAKGRIERLFRTLQDRLVKEMRLQGIESREEANRFLGKYLGVHNRWFSREAAGDVHRPLPQGVDLEQILSIRAKRQVRNDGTVVHDKTIYQVLESIRPPHVFVEQRLNGRLCLTYRSQNLRYRKITAVLAGPRSNQTTRSKGIRKIHFPASDHPWKRHPAVVAHPLVDPAKTGHF